MAPSPLIAIAHSEAEAAKLPGDLVCSIIRVESGFDPFRIRYEPGWKWGTYFAREHADRLGISVDTEELAQKVSWGLMQIVGASARNCGYHGHLTALCDPYLGVRWGCKKLRALYEKYADETDAVAAYNAGSPRKTKGGMYENQRYVDKVYAELLKYRGSTDRH